ncbi:hypothetical protein SPHINGO8BC_20011 [Sphingobacterium multivorum]|uniref:Uncharacterized protein n=1 Tax=Sphingobacterium multivorum TaxID=28454 RepID=A0A654B7U1_SPHMU|nr:hypothetical protein SPHINGO8BC_20011 [Sphingobacterium multivorum]
MHFWGIDLKKVPVGKINSGGAIHRPLLAFVCTFLIRGKGPLLILSF